MTRGPYRHAHAAGAVYGAMLERELSERLGVSWVTPQRRVPMREIAGVPEGLIAQFSTRRAAVLATYQRLEAEWRAIHGRTPTHAERAGMMDEATTRSRYRKARGDVCRLGRSSGAARITPDPGHGPVFERLDPGFRAQHEFAQPADHRRCERCG